MGKLIWFFLLIFVMSSSGFLRQANLLNEKKMSRPNSKTVYVVGMTYQQDLIHCCHLVFKIVKGFFFLPY